MVRKVPEDKIVDAMLELIEEVEPNPDRPPPGVDGVTFTPDWDPA